MLFPLLIGGLLGAEVVEPGVVDRKVKQITTPPAYVETCEIAPSVVKGEVLICKQEDGSYTVRDI